MSVLIEGMEMPPDGRYAVCVTHDSHGVVHWVFQNQDTLEFLKHRAVTEVPEPHGRLIDADEMFDEFVAEGQRSKRYKLGEKWELNGEEIRSVISRLPTVIPANEEG